MIDLNKLKRDAAPSPNGNSCGFPVNPCRGNQRGFKQTRFHNSLGSPRHQCGFVHVGTLIDARNAGSQAHISRITGRLRHGLRSLETPTGAAPRLRICCRAPIRDRNAQIHRNVRQSVLASRLTPSQSLATALGGSDLLSIPQLSPGKLGLGHDTEIRVNSIPLSTVQLALMIR